MADDSTPDPSKDEPKPDPKNEPAKDEADKDEKLGEGGKKALDDERRARRTAEREAKKATDELEKLRAEHATDQEKAIAAAKDEGKKEALETANKRLLKAEVTALAANKLTDPSDAVRHLDIEDFTISDDGEVDKKAISAAIDELVEAKPYLAGKGGRPTGDGGGGPRGTDGEQTGDDWLRKLAGVKPS